MLKKTILLLAAATLLIPCGFAQAQSRSSNNAYGNGVHLYFSGRHQEAINAFNTAIGENSQDARAYFFRGLAQMGSGNSAAADADFQQGAYVEASGRKGRSKYVSRSLERVQGGMRMKIEDARKNAMGMGTGTFTAGTTAYPQSIISDPIISQPIISSPIVSQPIISGPIVSQPIISSPIVSQPIISSPIVSQPIISNPIVSQPMIQQQVYNQPVYSQPAYNQPVYGQACQPTTIVYDGGPVGSSIVGSEPTPAAGLGEVIESNYVAPAESPSIFTPSDVVGTEAPMAAKTPMAAESPMAAKSTMETPSPMAAKPAMAETADPLVPTDSMAKSPQSGSIFGGATAPPTPQAQAAAGDMFGGAAATQAEVKETSDDIFGNTAEAAPEMTNDAFGQPAAKEKMSMDKPKSNAFGEDKPAAKEQMEKPKSNDPFGEASPAAKPTSNDPFGEPATETPPTSDDPFGEDAPAKTPAKPASDDPFGDDPFGS